MGDSRAASELAPVDPEHERTSSGGFGELALDVPDPQEHAGRRSEMRSNDRHTRATLRPREEEISALSLACSLPTVPPNPAGAANAGAPDASMLRSFRLSERFEAFADLVDEPPPPSEDTQLRSETRLVASAPAVAAAEPAPSGLTQAQLEALSDPRSVPRLVKTPQQLSKLPIDHRAGFLLAHMDGMQSMEEILDVCAMPAAAALEIIRSLMEMGVIEID